MPETSTRTDEVTEWADELWHRAIDSDSESGPALLADALRRAAESGEGARNAPSWVQAVTPAEIVRQRSLKWPDFHPEDFCHQCGRRNPCWFADTEVWQAATGSTGDGGGVLCPSCFAELWATKTGKTAILWRLSIDPRSRDAAPSPAARVDENPYMLADTPEEFERVSRIAAERHQAEAARIDARADDPAAAVETRSGFPSGPDRQMWTFR